MICPKAGAPKVDDPQSGTPGHVFVAVQLDNGNWELAASSKINNDRTMQTTLLIIFIFFSAESYANIKVPAEYRGKYMFIRNEAPSYPVNSSCVRIGPKELKALKTYKACQPYKGENPPLQETVAKCEKEQKLTAYLFNDKKSCVSAQKELSDGDAT